MEPTERAFELTKPSQVSSTASKVGSTEFTDIALAVADPGFPVGGAPTS